MTRLLRVVLLCLATLGPVAALLFLFYFPERYRVLFLLAFFPGLLAIGLEARGF